MEAYRRSRPPKRRIEAGGNDLQRAIEEIEALKSHSHDAEVALESQQIEMQKVQKQHAEGLLAESERRVEAESKLAANEIDLFLVTISRFIGG